MNLVREVTGLEPHITGESARDQIERIANYLETKS